MTVQRNSFLQNLCLLSCCVCAQCLSVRSASPGDNVTVHCGLTVPRIHWFRQRPGQLPLFILHSLSTTNTNAKYFNGSGDHHSLEAHNRLLIWNVTAEDSGTYYCAKKEDETLVFHNGTVLSVTDPDGSTTTVPPPDSATKSQNQPETWKTTLMTVSLVCNVMFLIAIVVLIRKLQAMGCFCAKKSENSQEVPQQTDMLYSEVHLSEKKSKIKSRDIHTTYAEVQFC